VRDCDIVAAEDTRKKSEPLSAAKTIETSGNTWTPFQSRLTTATVLSGCGVKSNFFQFARTKCCVIFMTHVDAYCKRWEKVIAVGARAPDFSRTRGSLC